MPQNSNRVPMLAIGFTFMILPILYYVMFATKMTGPMTTANYIFAAVPLLAFPVMAWQRRVPGSGSGTVPPYVFVGLAMAELGVLLSVFMGQSKVGVIAAMAVAIPVMMIITVRTLIN